MKKAVIVGVNINNDEFFEESLKELKGLAKACDIKVVGTLTQNLKTPNKKSFIGPGKIETLSALAESYEADVIIFDNELSPLQYKTLEEALKIEVIDRTLLILNIRLGFLFFRMNKYIVFQQWLFIEILSKNMLS